MGVANDCVMLTPYRAQIDALRNQLKRTVSPKGAGKASEPVPEHVATACSKACVSTVDGYQGREAEVVVFSTVRAPDASKTKAGIGFLADERRLNVALTRAKSVLVVVGHAATLAQSPAWKALLQHVQAIEHAFY